MGSRAVITWDNVTKRTENSKAMGIFLQDSGEPEYIRALLNYCELQGFRSPDYWNNVDMGVCFSGFARFCQVVCNYFGNKYGGLGCYVGPVCELGFPDDNGFYICDHWNIKRRYRPGGHTVKGFDLLRTLRDINEAQPADEQLADDFLEKFAIYNEVPF